MIQHIGKQTLRLDAPVCVAAGAAVVGSKEGGRAAEGAL